MTTLPVKFTDLARIRAQDCADAEFRTGFCLPPTAVHAPPSGRRLSTSTARTCAPPCCGIHPSPLHFGQPPQEGRAIGTKSRFIAVAGSIGAGKSSLIRFLEERFGLMPFYERNEDNPFLEDFYRDMPGFAFPAQIWFLARKLRAHQEIRGIERPAVLDRTVYEDAEVFAAHLAARGLFPTREYETYTALYRTIRASLPPPDLLIYLKSSPRTQARRIALRGRAMERDIDPAYLRGLNRLYRAWIGRWRLCPVLVLEADRMDFVADLAHQADVITTLRRHLAGS